ncbi:MAG: hypothetical protein KGJ57_05025 [Sphingomonadales bacterium]|nr:hypothetical protein [Sphingomonadales bacterium]MDE2168779.1 hypothetical protein [Sphingomonadales bacterium]
MSAETYKVAIKLELMNLAIPGLITLSRYLKTGEKDAAAYQARLTALSKTAIAAGAIAAAGFAGLRMFKEPIEEAKRYQTELTKIASLNLGAGITAHADQFARSANIIGNSATQMAEQYGDALAIFKNTKEADFVAPIMAKLNFANHALYGEGGASRTSAMYGLLKAIEYRGGTKSEADFKAQAEDAAKIVNASRGRVDGRQLLQVMQTGGILAKQMSNSAFYLKSEPLIQEMGGFRFGTGLNAVYGNLGQGRGSVLSQQELYRLGLLDRSKVQFNKLGRLKRALPGAFVGMDALLNGGVEGLLSNVLLPAFARKGITKEKDVLNELGMITSNSRGAALLAAAYQQRQKLAVQSAANSNAMGLDDTVNAGKGTAAGQEAALLAREATLKMQIGMVILPAYVKALEMTSSVLQGISTFAEQHQTAFKGLVAGFASLSAAMAVGGTLRLVGVAFQGLQMIGGLARIVPIVTTVAGVMGGPLTIGLLAVAGAAFWAYRNWNTVLPELKKIWNIITAVWKVGAEPLIAKAHEVWQAVTPTISPIFDHILNFVSRLNAIASSINPVVSAFHGLGAGIDALQGWATGINNGASDPHGTGSPFIAATSRPIVIHHESKLDSGVIYRSTTRYMLRDLGRPNTGSNTFDPSRSLPSTLSMGF